MRPVADQVYRRVFGQHIEIQRFDREDGAPHILDQAFAIDVQLTLPASGMAILGQEKFLRAQYASFRTVTVEYWQDPATHEPGDWFRLACQFYFVGYGDGDAMEPWVLLDWPRVVLATEEGRLCWRNNVNQNGRARASFRYIPMDELPRECCLATCDSVRRAQKALEESEA
jgi:hypothetical protein